MRYDRTSGNPSTFADTESFLTGNEGGAVHDPCPTSDIDVMLCPQQRPFPRDCWVIERVVVRNERYLRADLGFITDRNRSHPRHICRGRYSDPASDRYIFWIPDAYSMMHDRAVSNRCTGVTQPYGVEMGSRVCRKRTEESGDEARITFAPDPVRVKNELVQETSLNPDLSGLFDRARLP